MTQETLAHEKGDFGSVEFITLEDGDNITVANKVCKFSSSDRWEICH